jgi:hypothetical protein
MTADLPRATECLDERRFVLVIPESLTEREQLALARRVFAEAGMEQCDDGVTCLCGLEADFPSEPPRDVTCKLNAALMRLSPVWRYTLAYSAALVLWVGVMWARHLLGVR